MKYGKRILLMLMAACLIGTSASACEEGHHRSVRLESDEAQQIHVFTQCWDTIYPMDGNPLKEFAVTDLDGNGLLEILTRAQKEGTVPLVYEVNPQRQGITLKSKQWYYRHVFQHDIAWFVMHPETAAGLWVGRTETVEWMLQDSYDIYMGRKNAFG